MIKERNPMNDKRGVMTVEYTCPNCKTVQGGLISISEYTCEATIVGYEIMEQVVKSREVKKVFCTHCGFNIGKLLTGKYGRNQMSEKLSIRAKLNTLDATNKTFVAFGVEKPYQIYRGTYKDSEQDFVIKNWGKVVTIIAENGNFRIETNIENGG